MEHHQAGADILDIDEHTRKAKDIHLFYSNIDFDHQKRTTLGKNSPKHSPYISASTSHWYQALKHLLENKYIEEKQPFLDIGSGDGRILALTALHDISSHGIEINEELAKQSEQHLQHLHKENAIAILPKISVGDITEDKTAKKLFKGIKTIFTYNTLVDEVIKNVSLHSPKETTLILFDAPEQEIEGYTKTATFTVDGKHQHISDMLCRGVKVVQVFKKN